MRLKFIQLSECRLTITHLDIDLIMQVDGILGFLLVIGNETGQYSDVCKVYLKEN